MYGLAGGAQTGGATTPASPRRCQRAAGSRARRGRTFARLAEKLAEQGLLAGTEHKAPPNAEIRLLALRWKVLVTNPAVTRRPDGAVHVHVPAVADGAGPRRLPRRLLVRAVPQGRCVCHVRRRSTARGLLLLVFVLGGGIGRLSRIPATPPPAATVAALPRGMGVGIYLVWPAFYTDVTDAYRAAEALSCCGSTLAASTSTLVVADRDAACVAAGLRAFDALLLLVALQLLEMVKQLSPIIRADGYHILSDATGIPDLSPPTSARRMRRLIPGRRREPSALTGTRLACCVTSWVLVIVPVLLSLAPRSAVLLLPRLATKRLGQRSTTSISARDPAPCSEHGQTSSASWHPRSCACSRCSCP